MTMHVSGPAVRPPFCILFICVYTTYTYSAQTDHQQSEGQHARKVGHKQAEVHQRGFVASFPTNSSNNMPASTPP
jgi:hypothetical protein